MFGKHNDLQENLESVDALFELAEEGTAIGGVQTIGTSQKIASSDFHAFVEAAGGASVTAF